MESLFFQSASLAQGKNVDAKQYQALTTGLAALDMDIGRLSLPASSSSGEQQAITDAPAPNAPNIDIFEDKAKVSDVHWHRVVKVISLLDKADKDGTALYQRLMDMETTNKLEKAGQRLLNELEDLSE